jgi:hypothetical protein
MSLQMPAIPAPLRNPSGRLAGMTPTPWFVEWCSSVGKPEVLMSLLQMPAIPAPLRNPSGRLAGMTQCARAPRLEAWSSFANGSQFYEKINKAIINVLASLERHCVYNRNPDT